jgi:hypothetical protein
MTEKVLPEAAGTQRPPISSFCCPAGGWWPSCSRQGSPLQKAMRRQQLLRCGMAAYGWTADRCARLASAGRMAPSGRRGSVVVPRPSCDAGGVRPTPTAPSGSPPSASHGKALEWQAGGGAVSPASKKIIVELLISASINHKLWIEAAVARPAWPCRVSGRGIGART